MRVFLLGATPCFDTVRNATPTARLAATGGNAGNQIIAYGLLNTFKHSEVGWDYTIGPDRVNAEYDLIVIAAANFLFPAFDFGGMADLIERTKLPVVMVGVGAQSKDMSNPHVPLKDGTQRLMKIVSERSSLIGVRGEYTARVLANMGITNIQVTGCPSYYMAGESGFHIRGEPFDEDSSIAIHASRDVFSHSFDSGRMRSVVESLYAEAARRNGVFVAQTEVDEITLAESEDEQERVAAVDRLMSAFSHVGEAATMKNWFESGMRVYWTVPEWIAAMKSFPLVLGTRFHGTMAALHAGAPALCICHDSRTTEMCEFLGIPWWDVGRLDSIDLMSARERASDGTLLRRYADLLPQYEKFLNANNLELAR